MRWVLAVVLLAAALRMLRLDQRPMHADEAIQADRLGTLVKTGSFEYQPSDYHGPALAYASLPVAWLAGQLSENTVRAVPAFFGVALVLLSYLIAARAGPSAGILAALFTAVSPGLVYYSRYYIPEMLLVCFSAAAILCVVEYAAKPRLLTMALAGIAAGLMFATKETAGLSLAALAAGFVALRPRVSASHAAAGLLAAALAVVLFLPPGDALHAAWAYSRRAVSAGPHVHPWYYYLQTVFASGDVVFLALGFTALRRGRVLATYTLALTLLYSALPYKTPWCAAGFLHGWILLAAIGAARFVERRPAAVAAAGVAIALGIQAWRCAFPLASDPRNPWVYGHTTTDVFLIRDRLEEIAQRHGHSTPIQIVSNENLWPLPWYLRRFSSVEWWRAAPDKPAPLILLSPAMEEAVTRTIYESRPPGERELYVNLFARPVFLRPGVEVRGYGAMSVAAPASR